MKSNLPAVAMIGASLFLTGCFGPGTPEEQLAAIEEMQAENLPMTDEQKTSLSEHIAKGREALAAGDKDAAGTAFTQALAILKKAEDAAIYNKAD